MLTAPMQVSLLVDQIAEMQTKLKELRSLHEKEIAVFEKRLRTEVVPERALALQTQIKKSTQRITTQHLFRALIAHALASGLTNTDLYKLMTEDTIAAGRPGVKRGSRAA